MPSKPTSRALRPILFAITLALLGGCSTGSDELVRVGTRTITVKDFVTVGRANLRQYPGAPESAKSMLLEDLVRRNLMLALADQKGLFRDSLTLRLRRASEERTLARALFARLMPQMIPVSDAEVDSLYRWRRTLAHIQLIYTANRGIADAAMNALHAGRDFAAVADQFTPTRTLPAGGDLGFQAPGSLVNPLDEFLRSAPLGVIQGPVPAPGEGWFIARILARKPNDDTPSLEIQRPMLAAAIQQRKQRLISTQAFQTLSAEYHVNLEPGASQELFLLANRQNQAAAIQAPIPQATPEQRTHVLARYQDAVGRPLTYTMGDALADIDESGEQRPNFSMAPAIDEWLRSQLVRRASMLEARRRHLDEDPDVATQLEERVNNSVLESVYNAIVSGVAAAGDDELQAAYERHKSGFIRLDSAHVLYATFADSAAAQALVQHGGHGGGTLRDAAKMAGLASKVVEERVHFPNPAEPWKSLQASFMSMAPNEWMGPMRVKEGWRVLQLLDKEQGSEALEKLPPVLVQNLKDEALAMKRDRRLAQVTDSLKSTVKPIVIRRDRLGRIPWPPLAGASGT